MNKIIVYGTHYGTTKKYALELARKTNIDAISYENLENINDYDTIIYLGGLYAGGILGMAKTLKKLRNVATCQIQTKSTNAKKSLRNGFKKLSRSKKRVSFVRKSSGKRSLHASK